MLKYGELGRVYPNYGGSSLVSTEIQEYNVLMSLHVLHNTGGDYSKLITKLQAKDPKILCSPEKSVLMKYAKKPEPTDELPPLYTETIENYTNLIDSTNVLNTIKPKQKLRILDNKLCIDKRNVISRTFDKTASRDNTIIEIEKIVNYLNTMLKNAEIEILTYLTYATKIKIGLRCLNVTYKKDKLILNRISRLTSDLNII